MEIVELRAQDIGLDDYDPAWARLCEQLGFYKSDSTDTPPYKILVAPIKIKE